MEAENEFRTGVRYQAAGIRLTDRFAFKNSFFTFNMFRFHDLWWAYKLVTQRRVNLIPVGKTYTVVLVFNGGSVQIPASKPKWMKCCKILPPRFPGPFSAFPNN